MLLKRLFLLLIGFQGIDHIDMFQLEIHRDPYRLKTSRSIPLHTHSSLVRLSVKTWRYQLRWSVRQIDAEAPLITSQNQYRKSLKDILTKDVHRHFSIIKA